MTRINASIYESILKNYPDFHRYQGIISGRYTERVYDKNHEVVASVVKDGFKIRYRADLNKIEIQ